MYELNVPGNWSPGMEMQYETIRPNLLYQKKYIPLPRGTEQQGHGCAVFYLCPSQEDTIKEIQTNFLRWYMDMYRWYTTDTYFREKIGKKHIVANMKQVIRRDWNNTKFPHPLKYMQPMQRKSMLRDKPNILVDLGEWTKFYFEYSFKVTIPVIVKNYITFLASKLNASDWNGYTKVLYIPINQWFGDAKNALGFTRTQLNNPLAIMLFAAYKYPEVLAMLPEMTIIIGDSKNQQFVVYHNEDLTKKNFNKIKLRLKSMKGFRWDDSSETMLDANFSAEEEDPESDINNEPDTEKYSDPKGVIPKVDANSSAEDKAKVELMAENRTRLLNDMKRNLVGGQNLPPDANKKEGNPKDTPLNTSVSTGTKSTSAAAIKKSETPSKPKNSYIDEVKQKVGNPIQPVAKNVEDLTKNDEIYDDEDIQEEEDDLTPIHLDDEDLDEAVDDAVDDAILELQDEDPNVLLNAEGNLDSSKVAKTVRRRIKMNYMPEHSAEEIERIAELQAGQQKIIPKMPTAAQVKSKKIEVADFSNAVKSTNKAITQSKSVNFDRDYNEKKLQSDIDNAVAKLSDAQIKVFVTAKHEEDTSTQLDLKKTVTYELEDEWGNKHQVKLDIPVIVDDKYIYVNGAKLLLGHQQIMMPLVKANPTDVQVVTWYNKLILRREGINDTRTSSVKRYIDAGGREKFGITLGNAMAKNLDAHQPSTLDIDMYAKQMMSFRIGHNHFILDREELLKTLSVKYPNLKVMNNADEIPVGYNADRKEVIYVRPDKSMTDIILDILPADAKSKIVQNTRKSEQKLLRTEVKIMKRMVPLALLLFFYEGFTQVMTKAGINWHKIDKDEHAEANLAGIDRSIFDILECADAYIVWERNPIWNTMLMNGMARIDMTIYEFDELDSQEIYANLLTDYFPSRNIAPILMQYYDFMIDPVTKEILEDYEMPTDFVSLLLLGNRMLADNSYTAISNAKAFRIRSNEIIAAATYKAITEAYRGFRQTQHKMGRNRKPDKINVKQSAVMDYVTRQSSLTNEASILNPILELEKAGAVTPRGPQGVGKERAMTLPKRAYDPSMMGIIGMTTSPDAKVGVNRQLTLEPNITSTRGYVKVTDQDKLDELSNANLLTPAELLSPPGALHDDGPRTSMSYKQSQYMLPVEGSTPVFFGNRVEEVVPYHMSREFVVTAKQDGKVVDIQDGIVVIQYKDGSYDSINTNPKMKKNSSSGFYIKTQMKSDLTEIGQKFKKNEVIAHDPRAFTKNRHDLSASMNIGVPVKVAIIPNYDIYEDAGPITQKLSDKFTTFMSMKEEVGIPAQSYVESMVDIGQRVEVGDPLIVYDPAHEDEMTNAFLNEIRDKLGEDLKDLVDLKSMPQVRTEYAGTISDIEVYTSVPIEELSPSLQKIVLKYTDHSKRVGEVLDKYKNPGDMNYYKCGQIISNTPDVIKADYQNRVKGIRIGDDGRGIAIIFYIEFKDIAKTGDKGSAFTALKFTTSHVIQKGMEAYSEYRPDEEISTIIAPGAVLARKTPSIQETMFANKCIIEMKRHALTIFFEDKDPNK